jgi:hypothetical protein
VSTVAAAFGNRGGARPESPALVEWVGWRGLTCRVPENWSPVAVSGEGTQGYLCVRGPDERMFEVKWDLPRRAATPEAMVGDYLDRIRKKRGRSQPPLHRRVPHPGLRGARPPEDEALPYGWEADRHGFGCAWRCGACGRAVLAELLTGRRDDVRLAKELIRGVCDHPLPGPDGKPWRTWALYGLRVSLPDGFEMQLPALRSGHQRFLLRRGSEVVRAERWGLAEIALRDRDLLDWYREQEGSLLRTHRCRTSPARVHGHDGWLIEGRSGVLSGAGRVLRSLLLLQLPRRDARAYLWRCPERNRIHCLAVVSGRRGALIDAALPRCPCHGDGA